MGLNSETGIVRGRELLLFGSAQAAASRVVGNHIENAAQGIDLHCDHVTVADNMVVKSFVGMKAMHGW